MLNLLKVTGNRLLKDKIFWMAVIITAVISLYISLTNAPTMAEWAKTESDVALENCYYNFAPLLGLVFASFTSLFLGVEYSDGTLRNKLIAGHSRSNVFLSLFMVATLGCLVITAVFLLGGLPGLLYFDGFSFGWNTYFLTVLTLVCGAVFYGAMFTLITMLIPNKALGAVISLVIWFVMLFGCSIVVNTLDAPKMICDYVEINGQIVATEPYPNPDYIEGTVRTVFTFISRVLPICPAIKMSNGDSFIFIWDIIYSLCATVILLICGCLAFRKKDIK